MGYAQDLLDEIEYDTCTDIIELEVEEELHTSIAKELKGKLSSKCAQKLIDSQ